ncbi:MAG: Tm-1-like ATP-binding domain-containing protein [Planctomycetes bacterium]|nr:Tm-1-like ATP-binding domain-containing protein [Planctomycetota bacterium]
MAVHLFATLDTKGCEAEFLRAALRALGVPVVLVDTSCIGEPQAQADVPRERVFEAAGTTLAELQRQNDRGEAVNAAARGATALALAAHARGELDGVLGVGGGAGTTIGTAAMRVLPIGVPKLMISTLASGDVRAFVGSKDIFMLNSIVDVSGINRISRSVFERAAQAMAGMVELAAKPSGSATSATSATNTRPPAATHASATPLAGAAPPARDVGDARDKPLIAASMFGVTTPCVERARAVLEGAGYEVLVFHATGSGGETLESLVRDRMLAGVLDVTTTELADELVGGVLSAGPTRLTAAAELGVPQVVSVGALDMVNFWGRDTVPAKFAGRKLHVHNANVTLMRTTPEENAALGRELGSKVARSRGPARIVLPLRGVSALDRAGQSFDDPTARKALFDAIRSNAGAVPVLELDLHINDPAFADALANALLSMLAANAPKTTNR